MARQYEIEAVGLATVLREFSNAGRQVPKELADEMGAAMRDTRDELRRQVEQSGVKRRSGTLIKKAYGRRALKKKKSIVEGIVGFRKQAFYWRFLEGGYTHRSGTSVAPAEFVLRAAGIMIPTVEQRLLEAVMRAG
ncbi:MAG: hypothetical protein GY715_14245 [Planctomycetes bacterium]|nr:hypothetical protein [Planctomycetota bacterium]